MLPSILFCIGIPGSGKSSWLKKFIETSSTHWIILSHDELKKEFLNNVNDQSKNRELAFLIKQQAIELLQKNQNVIIDQTNVRTKYRKEFLEDLPPCHLLAKFFEVDPAEAFKRISNDIKEGKDRSNVPEEEIYRMYGAYLYTKKVIATEGFEIL